MLNNINQSTNIAVNSRAGTNTPSDEYDSVANTNMYSRIQSTCHEQTPSGPGKSVRSLQVAADQRHFNVEMCRSRH